MSRFSRNFVGLAIGLATVIFAKLGLARYETFHNETFDLALYARMGWGLWHGSFWDPIINASYAGEHLAFILLPLGLVGCVFGQVKTLIVAQAVFLAATAWPIARFGERRFGAAGAVVGALAWLLYPNLAHVAGFEFHPGTCAVLPLAWALDALDRGAVRAFVWSVLGVLVCREDLALVTMLLGVVAWRGEPALAKVGWRVALGSVAYFLLFALVIIPLLGPKQGSLSLHFGKWGNSMTGVVAGILKHPVEFWLHITSPTRVRYLVMLLSPLAFLSLLAPRWLLSAAPLLAINLLSSWPSAIELDSHYQTTLLPVLVVAGLAGAQTVARFVPAWLPLAMVGLATVVTHGKWGGTPASVDWDTHFYVADADAVAARRAVALVPGNVSTQAPYALMPHLAERPFIRRSPPPDGKPMYAILDGWHRAKFLHKEDLLRTEEEPVFRQWLGRQDYGLVAVFPPYYVVKRGHNVRRGLGARYIVGTAFPDDSTRVAACLGVRDAEVVGHEVRITLVARDVCPLDLAIRIGVEWDPDRMDLLFDGLLMPGHLQRGDLLVSPHVLSDEELAKVRKYGLRIGAIRESGARPEHDDPISVNVPIRSFR